MAAQWTAMMPALLKLIERDNLRAAAEMPVEPPSRSEPPTREGAALRVGDLDGAAGKAALWLGATSHRTGRTHEPELEAVIEMLPETLDRDFAELFELFLRACQQGQGR